MVAAHALAAGSKKNDPTPRDSLPRTMPRMHPSDVKAWVLNHRAAAAREVIEMRQRPLTPAQAFAAALSLLAFDEMQNGSPFERNDPVSDREDRQMWEAWAKLRTRWSRGR